MCLSGPGLFGRSLVLTPRLFGRDGVSAVSREIVAALGSGIDGGRLQPEVWSLGEETASWAAAPRAGFRFRTAGGSKLRFSLWGLAAARERGEGVLVVALHLRLAPVGLPLAARGAQLAVFLHGVEAWRPLRVLEAMAVGRASILMANSRHTAARFRATNPAYATREVRVCSPGLPLLGAEAPEDPAVAGAFALVIGRLAAGERYKGHDLLLDVWPRVTAEVPAATLLVVGDGDDRPRLEARAAGLGLGDRVRFLGSVSEEALLGLYRAAAFFVMPSRDEGFGLVFLEAMRAGKACIGGQGAAEEVIEHGVTGLVVDPEDPDGVCDALVRLFREPHTRERMGRAGRARFREGFTSGHFRRRFRSLLGLDTGPATP